MASVNHSARLSVFYQVAGQLSVGAQTQPVNRRMKTSHFEDGIWPMGLLAAMPRKEETLGIGQLEFDTIEAACQFLETRVTVARDSLVSD